MSKMRLITAGLLCSLFLTGCQMLAKHRDSVSPLEDPTTIGTATVRDGILQGQRLSIPRSGFTLGDAISQTSRPGAFENLLQGRSDNKYLDHTVVLERGTQKIYLPLYLVQNTMAGGIQLRPGDKLSVTMRELAGTVIGETATNPKIDTRLFAPADELLEIDDEVGNLIVITGIEDSREYAIGEPLGSGATLRKLSDIRTGTPINAVEPNVIVLTRKTGVLTEVFIVPRATTKEFALDAGFVNQALLRGGDKVHVTRLEGLDLVRSGARKARLAKEYERRNAEEAKHKRLAELHERIEHGNGPLGKLHDACNDAIQRVGPISMPSLGIPGLR